jgi:hypothetical protein
VELGRGGKKRTMTKERREKENEDKRENRERIGGKRV